MALDVAVHDADITSVKVCQAESDVTNVFAEEGVVKTATHSLQKVSQTAPEHISRNR